MADPYRLDRFIEAQAAVIDAVRAELRAGRKRTHWMWFVFPQLAGLGFSAMAQRYAIASLDEARAYLVHPVLGPRLLECTGLATAVPDVPALTVFGSPDDAKFRSCMTLFTLAAPQEAAFDAALARYYGGVPDPATLERLGSGAR